MGLTAGLRRLHFEAEIILTSVLKASIEEPVSESSTPKPTPVPERNARLKKMRIDLPGVLIEGAGEPAHALVDECVHQHETRLLRYIDPAKCHSRESEVANSKTEKRLKVDSNTLSIRESKTIPDESIMNAYNLQRCFKRRGLAYDFSGLISFTAHERYVEALMRHLSLEPPPNFQSVTLAQILRADKEETFPFPVFPPYPRGVVRVLSMDVVRLLAKASQEGRLRMIYGDDPCIGVHLRQLLLDGEPLPSLTLDDFDNKVFAMEPSCHHNLWSKMTNRTWAIHHVKPEQILCMWSADYAAEYYQDVEGAVVVDEARDIHQLPDLCGCATDDTFLERSDLDKLQAETQRILEDEE
eukprot:symbB.v1.2.034732.t1/scaffold4529.1/size41019/3